MANNGITTVTKPNIGLDETQISGVVELLSKALADEYVLYTKLRKYHWNVTGPQFHALHEMFEEQYTAAEVTIDEIAERIRAYGMTSPGTLAEFAEMTRLEEHPGDNPSADGMVANIVADHETMVRNLRKDIDIIDDDYDDVGAEDFLTGLLQDHQERAWMLRSFLEGKQV